MGRKVSSHWAGTVSILNTARPTLWGEEQSSIITGIRMGAVNSKGNKVSILVYIWNQAFNSFECSPLTINYAAT